MKKSVIVLSLFALAACTSNAADSSPPPEKKQAQSFKGIEAPMREDVAVRITGADNGGAVKVVAGTTISVALVGVPTAGYQWAPAAVPPFLVADGETGGPTSEAQLQPGFSGGSHWEVFFFRVAGEGEGVLKFEQRRPWEEETDPPSDEFSVTVSASAR